MRPAILRSVASQVHRPRLIAGLFNNGCHGSCARAFSDEAPGNGDIDNIGQKIRQGVKPADKLSSSELLDIKEVTPAYGSRPSLVKAFSDEARALSKNYAFLFGPSGVLFNGHTRIDGSLPALRAVKLHNVRYMCFADPGGMSTEAETEHEFKERIRANKQDRLFQGNIIHPHTPLRLLPEEVKQNQVVYIAGRKPNKARNIAQSYGFKKIVTGADLLDQNLEMFPFDPLKVTGKKGRTKTQPLPDGTSTFKPRPKNKKGELNLSRKLKIDHIFIWNEPRDWFLEIQLILDMLISQQGYIGTISTKNGDTALPSNGWLQDSQPKIWVNEEDFEFGTAYHLRRLGTGAFLEALKSVWRAKTGCQDLEYEHVGKLSGLTLEYAHDQILRAYARRLLDRDLEPVDEKAEVQRVYVISDNPEKDLEAVLDFKPEGGTEYIPILVRSGDWSGTEKQLERKPATVVDDVLDAVVWAMRHEGIDAHREILDVPKRLLGLVGLGEVVREEEMAEKLRLKRG
ncbi:unnamed protein product [Clonostachys rosea]|uniref:Uncharacterized protein n=1 Tax=Bionectria ochroleuca TaxID=29856 RepID=A0ABY6UGQ3_BIOOC|nr:unnamed protein product [Clonostachys rosea]